MNVHGCLGSLSGVCASRPGLVRAPRISGRVVSAACDPCFEALQFLLGPVGCDGVSAFFAPADDEPPFCGGLGQAFLVLQEVGGAITHADPVAVSGERVGALPAGERVLRAAGGGVEVALQLDERRVAGGDLQARADRLRRLVVMVGAKAGECEQAVTLWITGSIGEPLLVARITVSSSSSAAKAPISCKCGFCHCGSASMAR